MEKDMVKYFKKIEVNSGMVTGSLSTFETDFQGNPYLLDKNEGTPLGCTLFDKIMTSGPDGFFNNQDFANAYVSTGLGIYYHDDNVNMGTTPFSCPGGNYYF